MRTTAATGPAGKGGKGPREVRRWKYAGPAHGRMKSSIESLTSTISRIHELSYFPSGCQRLTSSTTNLKLVKVTLSFVKFGFNIQTTNGTVFDNFTC